MVEGLKRAAGQVFRVERRATSFSQLREYAQARRQAEWHTESLRALEGEHDAGFFRREHEEGLIEANAIVDRGVSTEIRITIPFLGSRHVSEAERRRQGGWEAHDNEGRPEPKISEPLPTGY